MNCQTVMDAIRSGRTALGIELGSTRIKAVAIDENHATASSGDYTWKSTYENGIWTYDLAEVWKGLKTALSGVSARESVAAMGVSAMMHGYLAFDKDWNLLVPFRTWQNTITGEAAAELTELQYEVHNLAFQQEVVAKVADKSSNAIQTLVKNQ